MVYLIFHLTRFYHEVSTPVQGVCHSLKRFGGRWQANEQVGNNLAGEREKMAIILPTGQWYAPSAVINDAGYCMVLHGIA